jgi:quercetin dioxygenase-like cupin family protein
MPYFSDIPAKALAPGLDGHYVHGQTMTVGEVRIKAGSTLAAHQHPHEQITMMLEGEMDMQIGDQHITLLPGMVYVIPSNTPHSAIAKKDSVVIDVFHPIREDYRVS